MLLNNYKLETSRTVIYMNVGLLATVAAALLWVSLVSHVIDDKPLIEVLCGVSAGMHLAVAQQLSHTDANK